MRFFFLILLVALLLAGGYYLYEQPRVKQLFSESKKVKDPLAFLEELPKLSPQKPKPAEKKTPRPATLPAPDVPREPEEAEPVPEVENQVPNDQVARTLLQILAAKGLAGGISLSVSDERVEIYGEVPSEEAKAALLRIVDAGRESRKISTDHLVVKVH